jgi:hypothetical protein
VVLLQPGNGCWRAEVVLSSQVGRCARGVSLSKVCGVASLLRIAVGVGRPSAGGRRTVGGLPRAACNGRPVVQALTAFVGCSKEQGLGLKSFNRRLVFERRVLAK